MIAIIDYGMGNLRSVQKGFEKVGLDALITDSPSIVKDASGVILPGVGAFSEAMDHLKNSGMDAVVKEMIDSGRPFLGICLGLQLLFSTGYEDGAYEGLGIFSGTVEKLRDDVRTPHMGWNQANTVKDDPLFKDIPDGSDFYFVHSYAVKPEDKDIAITYTDYGENFVSGISKDNVHAFQFHPEKSSSVGLTLLNNFGGLCQ